MTYRARRGTAIAAALLLSIGGETGASAAGKAATVALPPFAGTYQPQDVDERGLWMMADEQERKLRDSNFVLHDAALETYVRDVLCNTVGAERCKGVRIYIVRVAAFNASMMPNGAMQVWTGLLLRVRSEAELGAVLGHEFAHFEERHGVATFKRARGASSLMAWTAFLPVAGAAFAAGGLAVQMAAAGSVFSFSRDQEKAADVKSFQYLAASRYRAGAEADIWDRTMDEADATTAGRNQRSRRYDGVAFFASHPTSLERATYLHDMARKEGNDGDDGAEAYQAAMRKWRGPFLADQLKLNDFQGSEYLLGQLARDGWTAELLLARAELYRQRGKPQDLTASAGFYRDAIAKGASDPTAHRGLGMALLRLNQGDEGAKELKAYLAAAPDADDASMVSTLVATSAAQ